MITSTLNSPLMIIFRRFLHSLFAESTGIFLFYFWNTAYTKEGNTKQNGKNTTTTLLHYNNNNNNNNNTKFIKHHNAIRRLHRVLEKTLQRMVRVSIMTTVTSQALNNSYKKRTLEEVRLQTASENRQRWCGHGVARQGI